MNLSDIDSIQIQSDSLGKIGLLSNVQRKKFINGWNKKRVTGYSDQPFDSAFSSNPAYTSYYYKLTISNRKERARLF